MFSGLRCALALSYAPALFPGRKARSQPISDEPRVREYRRISGITMIRARVFCGLLVAALAERVQFSGNLSAQYMTKLSEDFMELMHDFLR